MSEVTKETRSTGPKTVKSLAVGFALTFLAASAAAQPPARTSLPGHVIPALARATPLPHDPARNDELMKISVALKLADEAGARAFEQEYLTPTGPNYHRGISPAEFTDRF